MNCSEWEEKVALYAGGDLTAGEAAVVERHVGECASCQLLLSGLRQSLTLFREGHAEEVDAAHYAAVRSRVLAELGGGRTPWWRWTWVGAAVAAVLLMVVAVRQKPPKTRGQTERSPVVAVARPENVPSVPGFSPAAAAPVRRRVHRKPAPPKQIVVNTELPADPLVVKLITNDPDVIIYWVTETKGE